MYSKLLCYRYTRKYYNIIDLLIHIYFLWLYVLLSHNLFNRIHKLPIKYIRCNVVGIFINANISKL